MLTDNRRHALQYTSMWFYYHNSSDCVLPSDILALLSLASKHLGIRESHVHVHTRIIILSTTTSTISYMNLLMSLQNKQRHAVDIIIEVKSQK